MHSGTSIGSYRVEDLLGAGGMGEVYRARDTKLNRDVAIKILPPAFASDPDRLARFKREAQVLASLNHPNIGGIYGFEDDASAGLHALILELVDGPTLADRLAQRSKNAHGLPVDEALAIARQICDALEAAHEQGIIHRDLKPANIKVREDGTVKVLDFGLAKAIEAQSSGSTAHADATQSPTITTPAMTAAGMILGTAAYMSPEQAKGKPADRRSDIWAFGCVLYEMLTGTRPFEGDDVADVLAAVLRAQPDWVRLPASTPAAIRRLLIRALAKDRKDRLSDATALRLDIDEARQSPQLEPTSRARQSRRTAFMTGSAVSALLLALIIAVVYARRTAVLSASEMRFDIATPQTREPSALALSPDGQRIAYIADADGRSMLWVRDLRSGVARPLDGTSGALYPFWSPNGRSLGFVAQFRLKRIDLTGGAPRDVAAAPGGRYGASWGKDGVIAFVPANSSGVRRVSEDGGEVVDVTKIIAPQISHRAPSFLPDGVHFTFVVLGPAGTRGVYISDVAGATPKRLFDADTGAVYLDGHLLFLRAGTLMAQPFDVDRSQPVGEPFRVAERVSFTNGMPSVAAANHTMIFRQGAPGDRRQLVWFRRSGERSDALGSPDVGTTLSGVELSPDGRYIAAGKQIDGDLSIWVFDIVRAFWTRLTSGRSGGTQGIWSPDGRRLAVVKTRNGFPDIFVRPAVVDVSQAAEDSDGLLFSSPELKGTASWSPDGRLVLFNRVHTNGTTDIWAVNVSDKHAQPVVESSAAEADAQISADGRWIAYQSDRSGVFEIWVQPFLRSGDAVQVSSGGGAQVRWRKDGRELYYLNFDERLTAVPVLAGTGADTLEFGQPVALFQARVPNGALQPGGNHQQYLPAPDGQRFLVNTQLEEPDQAPISVILNWRPQSKDLTR